MLPYKLCDAGVETSLIHSDTDLFQMDIHLNEDCMHENLYHHYLKRCRDRNDTPIKVLVDKLSSLSALEKMGEHPVLDVIHLNGKNNSAMRILQFVS